MTTSTAPTKPPPWETTGPFVHPSHWRKGQPSPNPAGRPRGALTKYHKFQLAMATSDLSPVEFLLAVMRKDAEALEAIDVPIDEVTLDLRRACAIDLLPYTHQKLPVPLPGNPRSTEDEAAIAVGLQLMSDEELVAVRSALRRASQNGRQLTFENGETGGNESDVET